MAKLGIFGIPFPVNYGGAGGNNILYSMAVEELSRVCATMGVVVSAHTSLCAAPIYEHGTEEQKMKYLPKLCSGMARRFRPYGAQRRYGCCGTADHGSRCRRPLYLNGNKIFITNAAYAHVYIVMAMTDKSQGTRGISAFIVERDFPFSRIGKEREEDGYPRFSDLRVDFRELHRSPRRICSAKVGKGFSIAMKTLDGGRVGIASQTPRHRAQGRWTKP